MSWFYKLAQFIVVPILRLCFNVEYRGTEHIPPKSHTYIVICNHCNNLDPLLISWYIKPMIRFMGKEELFKKGVMNWFFRAIGGFPVSRGAGGVEALDVATSFFQNGQLIGIFPEGTRSKDGKPLRPKSGTMMITRTCKADILPCSIAYPEKLGFRSKIIVSYGELIPYADLNMKTDQLRELKGATTYAWGKVLGLLGLEA